MRRSPLKLVLPSSIETGYIGIATFFIVLLGNGKLLLQKFNLINGGDFLGEQVAANATRGLNSLAHFQFTASAVTMLIWGGAGLLIYSLLQSVVRSVRTFQYEREFNSNTYIHPADYARTSFGDHLLQDTLTGFGVMAGFAVGAIVYLFVVLPASFAYLRYFIAAPGFGTALYPVMSLATAFVGTTIMFVLLQLVIRHHRLAEYTAD